MWYKNVNTSFFRFITVNAFDRQTDGQKSLGIPCVALCSRTVKTVKKTNNVKTFV